MSAGDTSAALDLDAIEARANESVDRMLMLDVIVCDHTERGRAPACRSCEEARRITHGRSDVHDLVAEVRRLRGQLAACVDALGVVVPPDATPAHAIVHEWQMATGEARALRLARDAAEEEVHRLRELFSASAQAFDNVVVRAWKAATGDEHEGPASVDDLLDTLKTMRAAARREGAEAMQWAIVTALDAMVRAEATEAELFRLTRDEDSAAEHHHKRAVLLEARVTVLGIPLPEVTP